LGHSLFQGNCAVSLHAELLPQSADRSSADPCNRLTDGLPLLPCSDHRLLNSIFGVGSSRSHRDQQDDRLAVSIMEERGEPVLGQLSTSAGICHSFRPDPRQLVLRATGGVCKRPGHRRQARPSFRWSGLTPVAWAPVQPSSCLQLVRLCRGGVSLPLTISVVDLPWACSSRTRFFRSLKDEFLTARWCQFAPTS